MNKIVKDYYVSNENIKCSSLSITLLKVGHSWYTQSMGLLIPFYIDPLFTPQKKATTDWEYLAHLKSQHKDVPVIAIINPYNGPGDEIQDSYTQGIRTLQDAGIKVVGYLPVGYFKSQIKSIATMYQQWYEWYPSLDGIFLDEFPDTYDKEIEKALMEILVPLHEKDQLIINPGLCMQVSAEIQTLPFSMVVSWENIDYPRMTETLKQIEYCSNFKDHPDMGCLVLEQRIKSRFMKKCIFPFYDWVFVTPYPVESNPWGKMDRRMVKKLFSFQF